MHRASQLDGIASPIATQVAAMKRAGIVKFARARRTLAQSAFDILQSNYQHGFLPLLLQRPIY